MFYGIVKENYLYEFNFGEAINVLRQRIKRAILNFIDKIDNWLDKHKDSKIKSFIKGLLQKVRKLLVKCDNIETESDAKDVVKDLEEYRSEFKENTDIKFEHVDIHIPEEDLDKIKNYCNEYVDKHIENIKGYLSYEESKYDLKELEKSFKVYIGILYKTIVSSIYFVLNRELLKTELYTTNPKATFFKANYYRKDVIRYLHTQANILADNFKLKTYNGENVDKYLENFKDHVTNKVIAFAHNCETNFNKMTKDAEIETYNKYIQK